MPYLVNTNAFGLHFKSGDLVDFDQKVPDLKRRSDVAGVFRDGTGPLDPKEVPEHLLLEKRVAKTYRDMFGSADGVCVISPALRALLEELDPGLHQFLPMTLDGAPNAGERYLLNVFFRQDSIVDEKTNSKPSYLFTMANGVPQPQPPDRERMRLSQNLKDGDIAVDKSRLGSANAWRERRYRGVLLISDVLRNEIKRQKLRVLPLLRCVTTGMVASSASTRDAETGGRRAAGV